MAGRWKGSRSRSTTSTTIHEQQQKIHALECLLAERDETVAGLEKKLSEQLQASKKLLREREELRSKNATLTHKLAEVSRKHSVGMGSTPPQHTR